MLFLCRQAASRCIGNLNTLFSDGSDIAEPASCQAHECLVRIGLLRGLFMPCIAPRRQMSTQFDLLRECRAEQDRRRYSSTGLGLRIKPFGIDRIAARRHRGDSTGAGLAVDQGRVDARHDTPRLALISKDGWLDWLGVKFQHRNTSD